MANENLQIFQDPNVHASRAQWYNEIFDAYAWHFRIKDKPASMEQMQMVARWEGIKIKTPSKREIVDFLLEKKIVF